MHVCAKAPQFDLLALPCLDRHWISVNPLFRRDVRRLFRVGKNIKYSWVLKIGKECFAGDYLFKDTTDFRLEFCFWLD